MLKTKTKKDKNKGNQRGMGYTCGDRRPIFLTKGVEFQRKATQLSAYYWQKVADRAEFKKLHPRAPSSWGADETGSLKEGGFKYMNLP